MVVLDSDVDFVVLMWVGAMPAEGTYPHIALAGRPIGSPISSSSPLLGIIESRLPMPQTIEEDFNAHYGPQTHPAE